MIQMKNLRCNPQSNIRLHKLGLSLAFCMLAVLVPFYACAATQSTPTILILDEADPDSAFSHQLREQVHSSLDLDLRHYVLLKEFLNPGKFSEVNNDAALSTYFVQRYATQPLSAIIAIGTKALQVSIHLRAHTGSDVPIVFLSFDSSIPSGSLPPNVTGIIVPLQFKNLVKIARLLVPELAQIALLGDSMDRQPYRHYYRRELQHASNGLKIIDLTNLSIPKVKSRVALLPTNAAIIYLPILHDASGTVHNSSEAFRAIAGVANRPIIVESSDYIGKGATGGFVLSAQELGKEVARLTMRTMHESASEIPVKVKEFGKFVFDARQLKKWDISESALPRGSDIRFQEVSPLQQYWWQILLAVIVLVIQCIIIVLLLVERRRRRLAELEAHQHLLRMTQMDRVMTTSALSASIAHELNQPLGAILNNTEAANFLLNDNSASRDVLIEILEDIRRDDLRAVEIIKHFRGLLKQEDLKVGDVDLVQVMVDTLGLIRSYARSQGVKVEFDGFTDEIHVRADGVHLQQVILNLALNAIDALKNVSINKRIIQLRASQTKGEVTVSIADNGIGIPKEKLNTVFEPFFTTKAQGTGLGLAIARTIIRTYGGNIWAENGAQGGAIFQFTLDVASPTVGRASSKMA